MEFKKAKWIQIFRKSRNTMGQNFPKRYFKKLFQTNLLNIKKKRREKKDFHEFTLLRSKISIGVNRNK